MKRNFKWRGYLISSDKSLLDFRVIHGFLTNSYWAKGRTRETTRASIKNSLCFGVYKDGVQIGFARVISDCATFAYIADVFILNEYRGLGLSKQLMKVILGYPELKKIKRWSLATKDAHGLYRKFGFTSLRSPKKYMELKR